MEKLIIRHGTKADAPQVVKFITDLAIFEKEPLTSVKVTPEQICKHLDSGLVHILMAEYSSETPVGFALFFYNFSTWEGKAGLYLEDLYVDQQYRGRRIGASLLSKLAEIALEKDCARFQWQVLDWNTPAIEFYEKKGGKILKEWLNVRVEGNALTKLAESNESD
jgi:GNAT superfamily N-acetyltransferase